MDEHARSWRVEFYVDRRGRSPALEFLRSLPKHEQAEALRVIDLLEEFGVVLGMPHARPISRLWELRPGPNRFFYVAHTERRFIILHGYRKQSRAAPQREIDVALRRRAEFLGQETER